MRKQMLSLEVLQGLGDLGKDNEKYETTSYYLFKGKWELFLVRPLKVALDDIQEAFIEKTDSEYWIRIVYDNYYHLITDHRYRITKEIAEYLYNNVPNII